MNEDIERFIGEAVPKFLLAMQESDKRVESMRCFLQDIAKSDKEKTETFVRQIEKLSSRLDAAYSENVKLTELLAKQQASNERLYNLLEHCLTGEKIINNSCN